MELSFNDFKKMALDQKLSKWEKIGFPDSYREQSEEVIFQDIYEKLNLENSRSILDVGCGCSELVMNFIRYARSKGKTLVLVDSQEMLSNIERDSLTENIRCVAGYFPDEEIMKQLHAESFDAIAVYSVLQYVFKEQNVFQFIHECIRLLKPGGRLLLGDIPNYQVRERFLVSGPGLEFLSNAPQAPYTINLKHEHAERIDDAVVIAILQRFRQFGCETYVLPQPSGLPFSNRREDILIIKR